MASVIRPPFDMEILGTMLRGKKPTKCLKTSEDVGKFREELEYTVEELQLPESVHHEECTFTSEQGHDILLSIFRLKKAHVENGHEGRDGVPGFFYIHGGGTIAGTRFFGMEMMIQHVLDGAVCITVEYRLAPENPFPAPLEDCYSALKWVGKHSSELGFDPAKLVLAGFSAGGGLAVGSVLLCRDRGGPNICALVLISPMLDDEYDRTSVAQYGADGSWSKKHDEIGWNLFLGDEKGDDAIRAYAMPGKLKDLAGLPTTYIECGSADIFRDGSVEFAGSLWECGVLSELHIWPGGLHAFQILASETNVAKSSASARRAWTNRVLSQLDSAVPA